MTDLVQSEDNDEFIPPPPPSEDEDLNRSANEEESNNSDENESNDENNSDEDTENDDKEDDGDDDIEDDDEDDENIDEDDEGDDSEVADEESESDVDLEESNSNVFNEETLEESGDVDDSEVRVEKKLKKKTKKSKEEKEGKKRKRDKPSTKNKKRARASTMNRLFDDYADDDGSEEEEEEDEEREEREEILDEEEKAAIERVERTKLNSKKFFDQSEADIARHFEERYEEQERMNKQLRTLVSDGEYIHETPVGQQALLPSVKDPKIFKVKCKTGMEKLLIRAIMLKTFDIYQRGGLLLVKSAFCGGSSGYIYVEAASDSFAREILRGQKGVYLTQFKQVPVPQMTSLLAMKVLKKPLEVGQFVRVKRGDLKGDLARIVALRDGESRALIQVVPRVDYGEFKDSTNEGIKFSVGGIEKSRPIAALFDAERAMTKDADIFVHRSYNYAPKLNSSDIWDDGFYDKWGDSKYRDGFLFKDVNSATFLDSSNVNPRLDELQIFTHSKLGESKRKTGISNEDDGDEEDDDDDIVDSDAVNAIAESYNEKLLKQIEAASKAEDPFKVNPYIVGDVVRVSRGELTNLIGRITAIDEMTKVVTISASGYGEIRVEMALVTKYVEIGAHVKVVAGRYEGNTGRVVSVNYSEADPVAFITTDGVLNNIMCNVSFLQRSSHVAEGLGNLMGYELYDLVQLSENESAVIIQVGMDWLRVITQLGNIRDVAPQEIRSKQNIISNKAKAFDANHNEYRGGDSVIVTSGEFQKLTGTVKHIFKGIVWLHSTAYLKNSGIFVAKSRNCALVGSNNRRDSDGLPSLSAVPVSVAAKASQSSTPNSASNRTPVGSGRFGGRDELLGCTVSITKGPFKGLQARVLDGNGAHYSCELSSRMKKVTLAKEYLKIIPSTSTRARTDDDYRGSSDANVPVFAGGETPGILGSETPGVLGNETPGGGFGGETPVTAGGFTPRHRDEDSAWKISAAEKSGIDSLAAPHLSEFSTPRDSYSAPTPMSTISLATPASAMTPLTVSSTGGHDAASVTSSGLPEFVVNMVVLITKDPYAGYLAVLRQAPDSTGHCLIKLRDGLGKLQGEEMRVPASSLGNARPTKGALVLIISGKWKGSYGKVKIATPKDIIVVISGSEDMETMKPSALIWMNLRDEA